MPDVSVPDAAQALLDAIDNVDQQLARPPASDYVRGAADVHDDLSEAAADLRAALAAAPPDDEPAKRWTYEVNYEGGSQPTDYGTGTEWDGSHYWVIYDGPSEIDDVVLVGMAAEDPTEVVAEIVAVHNRRAAAGSPPPTPDDPICHGGGSPHPFEPGIDVDDPEHPDPRWCDVCGESRAAGPPPTNGPTPETIAQAFHEAYERLAPSFGYETRKASAVPWPEVPENNQRLMTAVAGEVMALWAPYVGRLAEALDQAQLRSIEARNPGIDMDDVRRIRGASHRPDIDPEQPEVASAPAEAGDRG